MKNKILLCFFVTLSSLLFSQDNPYAKYGYEPKIATMTNGKFIEIHDRDTIVQIGRIIYNTMSKEIVGFVEYDTAYSEATLAPDVVSRWLSPDPLAHMRLWVSPYNFVQNNPIMRIDPDGRLDGEYNVDKKTGERTKVSDLGGDEVDFINYGSYKDNGTAFVTERTVQAERASPKENLGFMGEKIKAKVNSDFEKYSFERYWKGKGDYHVQVKEFENMMSNSKVEKVLNPITLDNGLNVTPKLMSFYSSGEYDAALGRATVYFNDNGTAIGLFDIYDFDSKSFGVRSFKNEIKTRAVNAASPSTAESFNIWFGIVPQ